MSAGVGMPGMGKTEKWSNSNEGQKVCWGKKARAALCVKHDEYAEGKRNPKLRDSEISWSSGRGERVFPINR